MQPESLSKAIQLSVAPVFLLAGIGALMNVISGRLARIVDNARKTKAALDAGEKVDEREQFGYRRRMQLTIRAIELLTAATLLISAVVAVMFFSVISRGKAFDHFHGGFVGTTVKRAAQRANRTSNARVHI